MDDRTTSTRRIDALCPALLQTYQKGYSDDWDNTQSIHPLHKVFGMVDPRAQMVAFCFVFTHVQDHGHIILQNIWVNIPFTLAEDDCHDAMKLVAQERYQRRVLGMRPEPDENIWLSSL